MTLYLSVIGGKLGARKRKEGIPALHFHAST
jgi:hypothetical protein